MHELEQQKQFLTEFFSGGSGENEQRSHGGTGGGPLPADGLRGAQGMGGGLEEAAAYSGIGINKLREITNEPGCKFVFFIGTKRMIKRRLLDAYIEKADTLYANIVIDLSERV